MKRHCRFLLGALLITLLAACSGGRGGSPVTPATAPAVSSDNSAVSPLRRQQKTVKIYVTNNGDASGGTVATYTTNGKQTNPAISGLLYPAGIAVDAADRRRSE
jgi:hypothetical protein